jgi:hypothetical protein
VFAEDWRRMWMWMWMWMLWEGGSGGGGDFEIGDDDAVTRGRRVRSVMCLFLRFERNG